MSANPHDVRAEVSASYTNAVKTETSMCCGPEAGKGVFASIAGYSAEELRALPADAVANSFGCGNPLAFVDVKEGETVLDLGSGAGIDVILASKFVGPAGRVIGVDMTDEMIERARKNLADAGADNTEVRKGIIEELPVEADTVDWVISNCVINLSPEKERVFAEIARVLRPGGRIAVSDIVVSGLPDWARAHKGFYSSCVAGAIEEDAYLDGLRAAGLVDVEVKERLVYDATQLLAFVGFASDAEPKSCCGATALAVTPEDAKRIAAELEGKIWSAKFHARKP